jgi:hypothetical protein
MQKKIVSSINVLMLNGLQRSAEANEQTTKCGANVCGTLFLMQLKNLHSNLSMATIYRGRVFM